MTASVSVTEVQKNGDHNIKTFDRSTHPAGKRMCDVEDKEKDTQDLLHAVQMHKCTGYCMRHGQPDDEEKGRVCRFGAGKEVTKNECDTPGFELQEKSRLITQAKNIKLSSPEITGALCSCLCQCCRPREQTVTSKSFSMTQIL